jgi:hypothetical protein
MFKPVLTSCQRCVASVPTPKAPIVVIEQISITNFRSMLSDKIDLERIGVATRRAEGTNTLWLLQMASLPQRDP